jgi:hypothetical protein
VVGIRHFLFFWFILFLSCSALAEEHAVTSPYPPPDDDMGVHRIAIPELPHYYMIVFGAQDRPDPRRQPQSFLSRLRVFKNAHDLKVAASGSHTFATFLHVEDGRVVDEKTISWMPDQKYFGPGHTMPEDSIVPGHNYSLDETLELMRGRKLVTVGPYEITKEFFDKASDRARFLDRGRTGYAKSVQGANPKLRQRALENRPGGAIDGVMAVSDIAGRFNTGDLGFAACREVMNYFVRSGHNVMGYPKETHPEVLRLMGLPSREHSIYHALQG